MRGSVRRQVNPQQQVWEMKGIADVTDQELTWVQPHALKMEYQLRAGSQPVATLQFRSPFGSLATGESSDGCWTFKRIGFVRTRVTVRACGTDSDIAVFRNNSWSEGGTLEFPDGRLFRASTNFWQTQLQFTAEPGEVLFRFTTRGLLHLRATVGIDPEAAATPELPWMVILGWYLMVMMQMDDAAAGVMAAGG
jgi:hypothetical protein